MTMSILACFKACGGDERYTSQRGRDIDTHNRRQLRASLSLLLDQNISACRRMLCSKRVYSLNLVLCVIHFDNAIMSPYVQRKIEAVKLRKE